MAASRQSSVGSNGPTEVTRRRAMKLARAKWGENATTREDPAALDHAGRAEARAALDAHRAVKPPHPSTTHDVHARAAWLQWREKEKALMAKALHKRCHVGRLIWGGSVNLDVGQGDTWTEACENAGLLPLAGKNPSR